MLLFCAYVDAMLIGGEELYAVAEIEQLLMHGLHQVRVAFAMRSAEKP